jgi:putative chitinase
MRPLAHDDCCNYGNQAALQEATMRITVSIDQVERLAPDICAAYRGAFGAGQAVLDRYRISATRLRVVHFVAQTLHESAAYTRESENLNYCAERLAVVWPARFRPYGPLDPALYAHNPRLLANAVYGGRMGNTDPDDGYLYRGRGLLQLTGRAGYAAATALVRQGQRGAPDFVREPDAVSAAAWCLQVAGAVWAAKDCNALADRDDVEAVTLRLNGGTVGLAEREEWTRRAGLVWRCGCEGGALSRRCPVAAAAAPAAPRCCR